MKTLLLLLIFSFQALVCFAELHTPDTILTTKESLFQQEINIRQTATATHKAQAARKQEIQDYHPQESLPVPELIPFQQALYPVMYYQPPAWQVRAWQQEQAAMQHARALRLAAYYPPAPAMFPMFEPESTPRPTAIPQPTVTPQPTPTPIVQRVIEKRVIVYVTPIPAMDAQKQKTKVQEAQAREFKKLTAESEKARQDAVLWLSVFISFCAGAAGAFVYLLKTGKKED